MFDETESWENETIYVNSFLSGGVEYFDIIESGNAL